MNKLIFVFMICGGSLSNLHAQITLNKRIKWTHEAQTLLKDKKILYVEREQYASDHHNTETLFQVGEICENKFCGGSSLSIFDCNSGSSTIILNSPDGVIRDPELSFDGTKVLFSWRKSPLDYYHIYEMNIDGSELKQLTVAIGTSDIDPAYLPDGGIVFSASRQPKYCMCNRHIMCNLYRMNGDGTNISQIGVSTLFEGHASVLNDGRILYDRWEYIDRNFGDAQGLWTVNPDGTKHTVYYGNNTKCPGAVIDARAIPNSDRVVCTFSACHSRPWGAIAIIDRRKGIDGELPVTKMWPADAVKLMEKGHIDSFSAALDFYYEDPYPIDKDNFLCSRTVWAKKMRRWTPIDTKSAIYLLTKNNQEELLFESTQSLFDPIIVEPRFKPKAIPFARNFSEKTGVFYVQNVYEGTHMKGVKPGEVKYIRIIESPEKRTWAPAKGWGGQGEQAPGVNWHSFEVKRIIGEVPVEEDGSVSFVAPANTFVYFQLLDSEKKMIQSMRSGTSLMPGETAGCIGCHEDRLMTPSPSSKVPIALRKSPMPITPMNHKPPVNFSFMEQVQPILTKRCVSCHDFDRQNRSKLVLAKDKNPFFNAAYIYLHMKKVVKLIGGGPAQIQQAYSWGSHPSKLTRIIEGGHHDVTLSKQEKETLYAWMDLNGVYYPTYETSFDQNMAGRSPLTDDEILRLQKLTRVDFSALNRHYRKLLPQISFDRPAESPCLDSIQDKANYREALSIILNGQKRLKQTPRGDIEKELVVSDRMKKQLENYNLHLKNREEVNHAINEGRRIFDQP